MCIRSSPLSLVTSFQAQQTLTSNKAIVNQSYASPSHKFAIQHTHYLTVEHVLLPGHMLPKQTRSFEVTVSLAVGKEKARCWRNEVYAEDRAHPLLPLGRPANLLDTKFMWENGEALRQRRDKGQWRAMTKFEIRYNVAYAS